MAAHSNNIPRRGEMRGQPLEQLCGAPMDPGRFLPLAVGIAAALAELHERNTIHSHINLDNIIVNPRTRSVTIVDCSIPPQDAEIPCSLEGTLAYMSPEQTGRINRVVDYRTDLYSLGVVF